MCVSSHFSPFDSFAQLTCEHEDTTVSLSPPATTAPPPAAAPKRPAPPAVSNKAKSSFQQNPGTQYASSTLEELGLPQPTALGVGSDSQSTVKLLQSPASKGKARHLDLRYNTLREKVELGTIRLFYIPTDHMTAGTGTKALAPAVFHRLRSYLLGHTTLPQLFEYITQYAPHYIADYSPPVSSS